jgi:uncharacterized membrane protein HdeD (DUF308 family)
MAENSTTPMCPMANMCKGMIDNPRSGYLLTVPGFIFIVLGMVIILYPQILAWLVAIALIVIGLAMLMMASFMQRTGGKR